MHDDKLKNYNVSKDKNENNKMEIINLEENINNLDTDNQNYDLPLHLEFLTSDLEKEDIYNLLLKNKHVLSNSENEIELHDCIKFLIKLNLNKINNFKLKKIFDLAIYFIKNFNELKDIRQNQSYESYYLDSLIENKIIKVPNYINEIKINFSIEKTNLFDYFIRNSPKNKKSLFILFFVIKNYDLVCNFIKSKNKNISSQDENDIKSVNKNSKKSVNKDSKKSVNDKSNNQFEFLLSLDDAKKLKPVNDYDIVPGNFSEITFLLLNDELHKEIKSKLNRNIDQIIVRKKIIADHKNEDIKNTIDDLGGINVLFKKEVKCLMSLFNLDYFPILLCVDYSNLEIYMNYCGENLNDKNIPKDWNFQMNQIISTLKNLQIYNNDLWINNFLVNEETLQLIDFGFSSFIKEDFPFCNVSKDEIANATNLIILLDNAMTKSIEKRLFF